MGKFLLCFVVAFVAVQTCSGASLQRYNELEELAELYAQSAKNIARIQDFIGKHISPVAREFQYKMQEVLEEKAIYPVIENLRNDISQIESQISDNLKKCTENAWTETVTATETTKRGIDNCISAAHVVEADLKHFVETLDGKATRMSEDLTTGYHKCLQETTDDDKIVCLNDHIFSAIDDIYKLDVEVKVAHLKVNHTFEEGIRHLKMCLQNVKKDAEIMSEKILDELNQCAQLTVSVKSHTELEELIAMYGKAAKHIAHIEEFIGKHISSVAREFPNKMEEVLEDKAIYPVIENLRNEISQIESEISDDLKECSKKAWTETVVVTETTKSGVDSCISAARVVEANLNQIDAAIVERLTNVSEELTNGFHTCMELTTNEEKVTCLSAVVYPSLEQIHNLDVDVKELHHTVNHIFEEGARHLRMCLQGVRENTEWMSEKIIADLRECAQIPEPTEPETTEATVATILRRSSRGILDFFRELKEKIEAIIHLATHLPTSIDELQDKINEIIAHVNMHFLISQLKSEVNDIIDQGGRNAEKCRPDANKKMNDLMGKSEADAAVCMATAETNIDTIQDNIHAVVQEGKSLLGELNKKILNCMLDNPLNPIGFTRCLEASYNDFKQKVATLQDKASNVIEESKDMAKEIIQEFSKCMSDVQLNLIKKGQDIISETEECVRFA